jgi:hypothetical protein
MRRRVPSWFLCTVAAFSMSACSSTSETSGPGIPPTEIAIDPSFFPGAPPCANVPGSMRSYVATVTDTDIGFVLPSSPPMPCSVLATFRLVVPGHGYTAEIDGYEADADALEPIGGGASGSRHIRLVSDKSDAVPRWTTRCNPPTIDGAFEKAILDTRLTLTDCDPLTDAGTPTTAVLLDPNAALDTLRCVDDTGAGDVSTFDVVGVPAASALPCGTKAECPGPTCFDTVTEGDLVTYRVEAHDKSGALRWGAECFAVPMNGVTIPAVCDPLSDTGAVVIDVAALLGAFTPPLTCGKDVSTYEARAACPAADPTCDKPLVALGVLPCNGPLRIEPLPSGVQTLDLSLFGADDKTYAATCTATVAPGSAGQAACSTDSP